MDAKRTSRSIAGTSRWIPLVIAACAVLSGVSPAARAAAGQTSVSLGAEYTQGDYGTSSTTKIWYFPVTLGYETDQNLVSLTMPYLIVEGTGNVVVSGGMGMARPTARTGSETKSGLGDLVLTGSHMIAGTAASRVDLTGKIKFGTADQDKNLGTGEDDFAVQLDFSQSYNDNSIYGSGGYKILGDPPGIDYDNVFYGSVGLSHRLDNANTAGLEFFAQEAVLSGIDGQSELTLFLTHRQDTRTKLTGYVLKGLADGSPDWGFGVVLKLTQ
jgi:hypothetical protein